MNLNNIFARVHSSLSPGGMARFIDQTRLVVGWLLAATSISGAALAQEEPTRIASMSDTYSIPDSMVRDTIVPSLPSRDPHVGTPLTESVQGILDRLASLRDIAPDSLTLKTTSLADFFRSLGMKHISMSDKKQIFAHLFPENPIAYSGTLEQNIRFLASMRSLIPAYKDAWDMARDTRVFQPLTATLSASPDGFEDTHVLLGDQIFRFGQVIEYTSSKGNVSQYTIQGRSADQKVPGIILSRWSKQFAVSIANATSRIKSLKDATASTQRKSSDSPLRSRSSVFPGVDISGFADGMGVWGLVQEILWNSGRSNKESISLGKIRAISDKPIHGTTPRCAMAAGEGGDRYFWIKLPRGLNSWEIGKLYEKVETDDSALFDKKGWDKPLYVVKDFSPQALEDIPGVMIDAIIRTGVKYSVVKNGKIRHVEYEHRVIMFPVGELWVQVLDSAILRDPIYHVRFPDGMVPLADYLDRMKGRNHTFVVWAAYAVKRQVVASESHLVSKPKI